MYAPRGRHRRWLTGLITAGGITASLFAAAIPAQAAEVDGLTAGASLRSAANATPAVPTSVSTSPAPQDAPGQPDYGCNGTGAWGWIGNGGVGGGITLQGKIADPDPGQLVSGQFEMWDGATHLIAMGKPADAAAGTLDSDSDSGWQSSGSFASKRVPTSYLVNGHAYGYRLRTDDGTAQSAVSTSCHFKYDDTAPTIQSINGSDITGGSCIDGGTLDAATTTVNLTLKGADTGSGLDHFGSTLSGNVIPDTTGTATLRIPVGGWGSHFVDISATDRAGNQSGAVCYQFYVVADPTAQVAPGDIDGDAIPDFAAVPAAGSYTSNPGLRYYPTNVGSPSGAIASNSTDGPNIDGSWTGALTAHRSTPVRSVTGNRVDDLWALGTSNLVYLYFNNSNSDIGAHANQYYSRDSRATISRPACVATITNCAQYAANWSKVEQLVAPGDMNNDGLPDLITEETGNQLWFFPGTLGGTQFGAPQLIGNSAWDGYTLIAPGNTPTDPGIAALWARANATGALYRYAPSLDTTTGKLTLSTNTLIGTGYSAADYPLIISVGDISGDGLPDLIATTSSGSLVDQFGSATAEFNGTPGQPTRLAAGGWNQITAIS
jgi:hypothetical protein